MNSITREITIPATEEHQAMERIIRYSHTPGRFVEVATEKGNLVEGEWVPIFGTQVNMIISGNDYIMLLAEEPSWAPTKPAGVFRESDMFAFLDYLRSIE